MGRKLAILLLTGAITLLTGCGAKSISDDEAKKFVNENYSASSALASGTRTTNFEKLEGFYKKIGDTLGWEIGQKTVDVTNVSVSTITAEDISDMTAQSLSHSFSLDGKTLMYTSSFSLEEYMSKILGQIPEGAHFSGNANTSWKTNDKGYIVHQETNLDVSMTFDNMTKFDGSIKMIEYVDYTTFLDAK